MANSSYHPSIAETIIYNPPYWSKKLDEEFGYKKAYEIYKLPKPTKNKVNKIVRLSNINTNRFLKNRSAISPFFEYNDFYSALNAYDFIHYFCVKNDINPRYFFEIFMRLQILSFLAIASLIARNIDFPLAVKRQKSFEVFRNKNIEDNWNENYELIMVEIQKFRSKSKRAKKYQRKIMEKLYKVALSNFFKVVEYYDHFTSKPRYYPYPLLKKFYDNTFEKAVDNICRINPLFNYTKSINTASIEDEVRQQKNIIELTKKRFEYGLAHSDDHFIGALMQDKIEIDIDTDKGEVLDPHPYFKKFAKSLSIGYYAKGLFVANEQVRMNTINDLYTLIGTLEKFNTIEAKKQIDIAHSIISFLKQDSRYKHYIPFKALAKYSGFSKAQIKSLIKELINQKSYKTFSKSYHKIQLPPLKISKGE